MRSGYCKDYKDYKEKAVSEQLCEADFGTAFLYMAITYRLCESS